MSQPASSKKILIIDDQPEIHADFRKILAPSAPEAGGDLARLRAAIKGPTQQPAPAPSRKAGYFVDSAHQGEEGFRKIVTGLEAGEPYSLAYVDMRMPPGWDGFRTIQEIWNTDTEIQLVVCTAYSDQPWNQIEELTDKSDRVLVLKKPFDPVEVKHMTATLSAKWRLARAAVAKRAELEELFAQREKAFALERTRFARQIADMENQLVELNALTQSVPVPAMTARHSRQGRPPETDPHTGRFSLDVASPPNIGANG